MKRRLPYFLSAFLLCGVLSLVLRNADSTSPKSLFGALLAELPVPAVPSAIPSLRLGVSAPAEPISPQTAPAAAPQAPVRMKATPVREVRVRAARDGRDYGWVQLPRGTRVELVRDEGRTLIVRYDQVTLRIDRAVVDAGMVVPIPREVARFAGL